MEKFSIAVYDLLFPVNIHQKYGKSKRGKDEKVCG
jgi:hypothetical protein